MTKEELQEIANRSKSFLDMSKKMGVCNKTAKKICLKSNIDTSHFPRNEKVQDYIGKKYFKLSIINIEKASPKNRSRSFAICLCDCGKEYKVRLDSVTSGKTKSCGCLSVRRESMDGSRNPAFKGMDDIPSSWLKEYERNAKKRGIEWNLSIDDVVFVYKKQNKLCALSNTKLEFGRIRYRLETNASIDRIDNSKGYIKDNIQIVLKSLNIIRGSLSVNDFINLCRMVVKKFE